MADYAINVHPDGTQCFGDYCDGPGCADSTTVAVVAKVTTGPVERSRVFVRDVEHDPGYEVAVFDPGDDVAIEPGTWEELVPLNEAVAALNLFGRHHPGCAYRTDHTATCDCAWAATAAKYGLDAGGA